MCRVNGRKQTSYWNRAPVSNASQSSWKAPRRGVATLPRQTIRLWPVVFLQTSLNSPQASFMAIFSRRIPWKADIKRRLLRDCNKLPISEDPVFYHHRYSFGFAIFLSFFFFFFGFSAFVSFSPSQEIIFVSSWNRMGIFLVVGRTTQSLCNSKRYKRRGK